MTGASVVPEGARFFKMTGSGNDFIFVDGIAEEAGWAHEAGLIRRLCDRRSGVGADGVVILETESGVAFRMVYYNSDGSRASFCGNAALCATRYATSAGLADPSGFVFATDAGRITGRIAAGNLPEVDLPAVTSVRSDVAIPLAAGDSRAGFALAGVPHLVILCADADLVDLDHVAPPLRHHKATAGGANVNYISALASAPDAPATGNAVDRSGVEAGEPQPGSREFRMRTYERGVEGETLACGSGAVASAVLASQWFGVNDGSSETVIRTSSGLPLVVRVGRSDTSDSFTASLRGEGRLVFEGVLRDY